MIYSSPGPSWLATKLALGSSGAALPPTQPVKAIAAIPETSAARAARREGKDVLSNHLSTGRTVSPRANRLQRPTLLRGQASSNQLEQRRIGEECVRKRRHRWA